MGAEYKPETDLGLSQYKLQEILDTSVEVPVETLDECIQDVLASRGGERWKQLDELRLYTRAGLDVIVGYEEPGDSEPDTRGWMEIVEGDETRKLYEIRSLRDSLDLVEVVNLDTGEANPVNNYGHLAEVGLLYILADAHKNTPLEELDDSAYRS